MYSSTYFGVGRGGSRVDNSIIEDDCVFVDLDKNDVIDNDFYQNHHDNSNDVCHHDKMKVLIVQEKN